MRILKRIWGRHDWLLSVGSLEEVRRARRRLLRFLYTLVPLQVATGEGCN